MIQILESGCLDLIKDNTQLHYAFYYYTNDAMFTINIKTFVTIGLICVTMLIIASVDYQFTNQSFLIITILPPAPLITIGVFLIVITCIRKLNTSE